MLEKLREHYEQELALLEERFAAFAKDYPRVAGRLGFSGGLSEDPQVQRLTQSFALLAANIGMRLADGAPQFTEALLASLHPHYLRPFPSCSIAQFEPKGEMPTAPVTIARGTSLTAPGGQIHFRTAYDVTVAPLSVADARFAPATAAPGSVTLPSGTTHIVSIALEPAESDASLDAVLPETVRLYLAGQRQTVAALVDTLLLRVEQTFVELDGSGAWAALKHSPLDAAGFDHTDALLPDSRPASFVHMLLEYLAFPEKFDFIDVDFGAVVRDEHRVQPLRRVALHLAVRGLHPDSRAARALSTLDAGNFKLSCTPVVNLFEAKGVVAMRGALVADYPLVPVPDKPDTCMVYSVDAVREHAGDAAIPAYHALGHTAPPTAPDRFWLARHDPYVERHRPGCETALVLVRRDGKTADAHPERLAADVTCTNRDLPTRLPIGSATGDLHNETGALACRIELLRRATPTFRPSKSDEALWRTIAVTTPNATQLDADGWSEVRKLFQQCAPASSARHVEAVSFIRSKVMPKVMRRMIPASPNPQFAHGIEITLSVDEQAFAEHSIATFAGVAERYFARYAPTNGFTQLVVLSKSNGSEILRGPLRIGRIPLI